MRLPIAKSRALAARVRARLQARSGVSVGPRARFGSGVRCVVGDGGQILIGREVEIAAGTMLSASPGARLVLGDGVFIGGGCIIAATRQVSIGEQTMIAELVSIRDHDHDPRYPPKSGKMLVEEVTIGDRVWIGAKATVVRGGGIGDDCIVEAGLYVTAGSKVLIGWDGGDATKPYAESFDRTAGGATRLDLKAPDVRLGDVGSAQPLALAGLVSANFATLVAAINTIAPGTIPGPLPSVATTATKGS